MMTLLKIHVGRDSVKRLMETAPHKPMSEGGPRPVTENLHELVQETT